MTSDEELLPCPFCGRSDTELLHRNEMWQARCVYTDCQGAAPWCFPKRMAIKAWNTRATSPDPATVMAERDEAVVLLREAAIRLSNAHWLLTKLAGMPASAQSEGGDCGALETRISAFLAKVKP